MGLLRKMEERDDEAVIAIGWKEVRELQDRYRRYVSSVPEDERLWKGAVANQLDVYANSETSN